MCHDPNVAFRVVSDFNSSNYSAHSQAQSKTENLFFTRFILRETIVVASFREEIEREKIDRG